MVYTTEYYWHGLITITYSSNKQKFKGKFKIIKVTLTKIKLQNYERGCKKILQKGQKREKTQQKDVKKLTKKGWKSVAA